MPPRRVVSRQNPPSSSTSSSSSPSAPSIPAPLVEAKEAAQEIKHGFAGSIQGLWKGYLEQTPSRLKLIDGFMFFLMLTGVAQFVYCVVVTNFPFNAFLGGFAATVGQFVLCGALRIQSNPLNKDTFPTISPERAFGDFLFGSLILHFFVWNYLG
ncbi:dolichyl-diphosphooligosaccharide-protein glycotransferase [Sporobolomyces salmoneus]|uniref:dolichyl-diphosphooligosaccharide-protein glycotransferase n=1 Tax=Sporobolomyces salmoneus TaxID=183962 RepID=UPI00316BEA19